MKRSQLFVIGTVLLLGLLLIAYRQASPGVRNIPPGPTVILSYPFEKPGIFRYGISIPGYQIGGLKTTVIITANEGEYWHEHHK